MRLILLLVTQGTWVLTFSNSTWTIVGNFRVLRYIRENSKNSDAMIYDWAQCDASRGNYCYKVYTIFFSTTVSCALINC